VFWKPNKLLRLVWVVTHLLAGIQMSSLYATERSYMNFTTGDGREPHKEGTSAWYAIYTRHQHEKTVTKFLTYKGFETFLPLYGTAHRWRDRTKKLSMPLFPCYVFLKLKTALERSFDILTTPGVHSLVSSAGQPTAISPAEIDSVRRAVESGIGIEPHPHLKCGEWVRVKSGPLAGIEGILMRKRNLYRLILSVEMLGNAAAVEVDGFQLERLNRD
jgi:transcription antitermination factor NusG